MTSSSKPQFSAEDQEIFKDIIKDHYQYPRHHVLTEDPDYYTVHLKNPSCGDDLTVQVLFEGDRIKDIRQKGEGCSICCSSASMMSEICLNHTVHEAAQKVQDFRQMVSGEAYDPENLGEALALNGVVKVPPRIKCATLAWLALDQAMKQEAKQLNLSTEDGERVQASDAKEEKHE